MLLYTDGQAFDHKSPKESYIAVVEEAHEIECLREDETLISFIHLGYRSSHDAEGLAILQALRYIEKRGKPFSSIYTDSLTWAGIANETNSVRGQKDANIYTRKIAEEIVRLKKLYHVGITWKSRKANKAGKFLGKIWSYKQEHRDTLPMAVKEWEDL